ncbi:MAG: ABC transporter substrate-binding protein [Coriobacteriales bacterium]|nr:ABC transporter substrate-binding protein [Coriobacteriales bacterium]
MTEETRTAKLQGLTRRVFLKMAGAAGLALAGACIAQGSQNEAVAGEAETITITDMGGTEVTVPTNVERYADAWYAHNEVTVMLDNAEGLVATHCNPKSYKWMYRVCPNMENALSTFGDDFNFEELIALEPQVIFDSKDSLREKCNEVGIPLVNCSFHTYEEMEQSIEMTAKIFGGEAPAIAERYIADLHKAVEEVTAVTDKLSDDERPSVLHGPSVYEYNLDGTGTIIDTWINAAGGKNAVVADTKGTADAEFSMEQIIAWNPDVIITARAGQDEKILNDPNWASIKAVQEGRVYVNPRGVFSWDRYGVEELLQIKWAAAILHPELFPDLDIVQEVKDFYSTYMRYELNDEEVETILMNVDPPALEEKKEEDKPAA